MSDLIRTHFISYEFTQSQIASSLLTHGFHFADEVESTITTISFKHANALPQKEMMLLTKILLKKRKRQKRSSIAWYLLQKKQKDNV